MMQQLSAQDAERIKYFKVYRWDPEIETQNTIFKYVSSRFQMIADRHVIPCHPVQYSTTTIQYSTV